jgi:hypothetical protein
MGELTLGEMKRRYSYVIRTRERLMNGLQVARVLLKQAADAHPDDALSSRINNFLKSATGSVGDELTLEPSHGEKDQTGNRGNQDETSREAQ